MRSLLDVNVLIALFDADHALHGAAVKWFAEQARAGWASCPLTQNGCMRVMSQARYANPLPINAVAGKLREATADRHHEFWPDELSLLDQGAFDTTRIHGPKQLTDLYLLGLAVRRGGRLVTFDHALAADSVAGAQKKHLVVL